MSEEKKETAAPKEGGQAKNQVREHVMGGVAARRAQKVEWTLERCKKYASRFMTVEEWETGAPASFKAASAKGWIAECKKGMLKDNVTTMVKANAKIGKGKLKHSA